jgi:hypothetical protein
MGLMQALMRLKRAEKVYTDMSTNNKKMRQYERIMQ